MMSSPSTPVGSRRLSARSASRASRLRRFEFPQLEQLLLLSASPFAALDQHADADPSLPPNTPHGFGNAFDFGAVPDHPIILGHVRNHQHHDSGTWEEQTSSSVAHDELNGYSADAEGRVLCVSGEHHFSGDQHVEVPHSSGLELEEGTVVLSFTADDVSGLHTLFSKDVAGNQDEGDLTVFVRDGRVAVRFQSAENTVWLQTADGSVQAGQEYDLAVTFGDDGLWIYLDGEVAVWDAKLTQGLEQNTQNLVIGANTGVRDAMHSTKVGHYFEGCIENFAIYDTQYDAGEVANLACDPPQVDPVSLQFDFGTGDSPLTTNYQRVTSSTSYTAELGYGWLSGTVDERDRGEGFGSELNRDFNFTEQATFVVDVSSAPATYDVTITMGDGLTTTPTRDDMGIFLEGELVDSVTTKSGEYLTLTYRVTVSDGQLTLSLDDLGGTDPFVIINSLQVTTVDSTPPTPLNEGQEIVSQEVDPAFALESESAIDPAGHRGWLNSRRADGLFTSHREGGGLVTRGSIAAKAHGKSETP